MKEEDMEKSTDNNFYSSKNVVMYIIDYSRTYMARMCGIPSNDPGITHVMELPWRFLRKVNYASNRLPHDSVLSTLDGMFAQRGTYSVLRLGRPENILLCTSRSLFSDKSLRKESSSWNEAHDKMEREIAR